MTDFDTNYGDNPWEQLDKNKREWYDPNLIANYRQNSVFAQSIPFVQQMGAAGGPRAESMTITELIPPHPDSSTLSMRQMWLPAAHIDSRAVTIGFNRYGGKVAYHKYDDMVTYWKQNNKAGIRKIMRSSLGSHQVGVLDQIARNAYISGALNSGYYSYMGGGSDFSALSVTDLFDREISMDVWLRMAYSGVPAALGASGAGQDIICFTSPAVIYDIQKNADFTSVKEYHDPSIATKYEVGAYKNVRYVQSRKATLWNTGTITVQANVTASITAGDGSPDPASATVDGTYKTGQDGVTHYIQLDTTDSNFPVGSMSDFAVHDMVTIHVTRTSDNGITNGVDFEEGTLHDRRIVTVDTSNNRLILDRPIMVDMDVDLGSGTYAYVTKGRHIHASIFVGAPTGIVAGVAQAPRLHTPPPVDDFESIYRFSWDAYMGYQLFDPKMFEVVFSAGTIRTKGAAVVQ